MSDLISRQDAIESVLIPCNKCTFKACESCEYADITEVIKALPSAEAVQGWIPCSERLPSNDGCYLVSTTGTNNDIIDIAYYTEEIWHKASRIKAWMPLPEPYREDGE